MSTINVSQEVFEDLETFCEMEGRSKAEVANLALKRFLARPSFGTEVFQVKRLMKDAWNIIENHVSPQQLKDWAYENSVTLAELNRMIKHQAIFTGEEPFEVK